MSTETLTVREIDRLIDFAADELGLVLLDWQRDFARAALGAGRDLIPAGRRNGLTTALRVIEKGAHILRGGDQ